MTKHVFGRSQLIAEDLMRVLLYAITFTNLLGCA